MTMMYNNALQNSKRKLNKGHKMETIKNFDDHAQSIFHNLKSWDKKSLFEAKVTPNITVIAKYNEHLDEVRFTIKYSIYLNDLGTLTNSYFYNMPMNRVQLSENIKETLEKALSIYYKFN